jgi:hypothetical protein
LIVFEKIKGNVSIDLSKKWTVHVSYSIILTIYIKVNVQPWLGNNGSKIGWNLNSSYIFKSAGRQVGGWVGGHKQCRVAQLVIHIICFYLQLLRSLYIWACKSAMRDHLCL